VLNLIKQLIQDGLEVTIKYASGNETKSILGTITEFDEKLNFVKVKFGQNNGCIINLLHVIRIEAAGETQSDFFSY